jgi:hypothetical protein
MMDSKAVSRWLMRVLAAAGVTCAALAAMLLGWVITAHAADLVPNDAGRHDPLLCEHIPDTICPPDFPALVIMPA